MSGPSTQGLEHPSTRGAGYGRTAPPSIEEGTAVSVMPIGEQTGSIIMKTEENNQGRIFIGWDTEVDNTDGFPLSPGNSITIAIDNSSQNVYCVAEFEGDIVRYLAIN